MRKVIKAFGFDPSADRDVGVLFLPEIAKTITNGSSPGHHNAVLIIGEKDDISKGNRAADGK